MNCMNEIRSEVKRADPRGVMRHNPDAHFEWTVDDEVRGRCSVWWTGTPMWNDHRVGMIGHYEAIDDGAGKLIDYACHQLREHGCRMAVGPMDGSTFRSYRFITRFGDEPRFFLEPNNPPEWVDHFTGCGFKPLARYFSAMNDDLTQTDPRIERRASLLSQSGVTLRPICRETFEADLRKIISVSRSAFRENLLYADPDESELLEMYRQLMDLVPLDLILLAEHAGQAAGFVFAVPDLNEAARGEQLVSTTDTPGAYSNGIMTPKLCPDTPTPWAANASPAVIVKTLAVLPHRQYAGLGQVLLAEIHMRARKLGFTRAIHALVRDSGHLRRISGRYARVFREYTLFARVLPG